VTEDWFSNWTKHFVLINQNADVRNINEKLKDYLKKYQGEESENELYLKPVKDIHLNSTVVDETANVGSAQNVTIFSIIAFMIIVVACINYINLTTAYSTIRGKEVGIRKVNGADRKNLIFRFLGESFIISVISLVLGAILTEFTFPYFNQLVNRNIEINYLGNWQFYLTSLLICVIVTLISGFYPALLLANFKPTEVLKGSYQGGQRKGTFRRILVIFQFLISASLVISTIFLVKQLNFMSNSDLGYNKEQVLTIALSSPSDQKLNQFKSEIEANSNILLLTSSDYLPMNSHNWTGFTWEGAEDDIFIRMNINYVGPEFLDVYDIPLNTGTGFKPEQREQDQLYVLINEQAVREMGWKDDALGRKILWSVDYRTRYNKEATVVGIVKDYHYLSMHHAIKPLIMPLLNKDASGSRISIKLSPKPKKETLEFIETKFQEIYDNELFNYQFADSIVHSQYDTENRMSRLVLVLTVIGIIIAISGLYGLTSFITNQRVKEIGIRKVMGASLPSILYIISKELLVMLALANLIAWPLAYLLVSNWLLNFEYQIKIQPYVFIMATAITFLLAILTVGFKILKTSFRNPVEALRYE
jgi:putative ABC transport system permease protein